MITNTDITKLKEVFATKKDLERFATKKDLERYATKKDLAEFKADVKVEFGEAYDKIDAVAAAVGRIENTLDGVAGAIQDLRTENGASYAHLLRHDRQIEALARETGIKIPN